MSWLNEFVVRRTALATLEMGFSTHDGNMLVGFDQSVTDVEPLVCTFSDASTLTTYLAAFGSTLLLVLYRFTDRSTFSACSLVRKLAKTATFCLGSVSTVLLSVTWFV